MNGYAFEGRFTNIVPVGLTPLGLRVDLDFTGTITAGPLTGATLLGTDFFLLRPDGIGQVHTRERITRGDRVAASLQFLGYVVPPIAMPDLSVLLSPDFQWPDIDLPMHGATFVEAASEEWSAATATVYGASSGAVNLAARTLRLEAKSLAPTSAGQGVDGRNMAGDESAGRPADTNSRC
jgi:hypothetical protein